MVHALFGSNLPTPSGSLLRAVQHKRTHYECWPTIPISIEFLTQNIPVTVRLVKLES
jgi:hypothetical protein